METVIETIEHYEALNSPSTRRPAKAGGQTVPCLGCLLSRGKVVALSSYSPKPLCFNCDDIRLEAVAAARVIALAAAAVAHRAQERAYRAAVRKNGGRLGAGRPPAMTQEQATRAYDLWRDGYGTQEIADHFGIGRRYACANIHRVMGDDLGHKGPVTIWRGIYGLHNPPPPIGPRQPLSKAPPTQKAAPTRTADCPANISIGRHCTGGN